MDPGAYVLGTATATVVLGGMVAAGYVFNKHKSTIPMATFALLGLAAYMGYLDQVVSSLGL